jgi:LysR family transcriptional regulator, cys regulon transcriptional activator
MELRQLRSLVTLAETGFNVTEAASQLHLVQSAVSQHMTKLEDELGVVIFNRQGRRLTGFTEAGNQVLFYARKALSDTSNIQAIGRDFVEDSKGVLRIGTTHTQACYMLPPVLRSFSQRYPGVDVQLHQGSPRQLIEMIKKDHVDFIVCTEALGDDALLDAIHCYRWNRSLIAPDGHPVLQQNPLTHEHLCEYSLITYVSGFTGADHFKKSFARLGLKPRIVLSAADTDVIKTYVREGFGVGIIVSFAYSETKDQGLKARDLSQLFPWEVTRIAYMKERYLRRYEQQFIDLLQNGVGDNALSLLKD